VYVGMGVCNEVKDSPLFSTHKDEKTLRQIIEREKQTGRDNDGSKKGVG
jgi:hypothetical protein